MRNTAILSLLFVLILGCSDTSVVETDTSKTDHFILDPVTDPTYDTLEDYLKAILSAPKSNNNIGKSSSSGQRIGYFTAEFRQLLAAYVDESNSIVALNPCTPAKLEEDEDDCVDFINEKLGNDSSASSNSEDELQEIIDTHNEKIDEGKSLRDEIIFPESVNPVTFDNTSIKLFKEMVSVFPEAMEMSAEEWFHMIQDIGIQRPPNYDCYERCDRIYQLEMNRISGESLRNMAVCIAIGLTTTQPIVFLMCTAGNLLTSEAQMQLAVMEYDLCYEDCKREEHPTDTYFIDPKPQLK